MADIPLSFVASEVKKHDNDRYFCTLFAQDAVRERLFALYAFNQEIAKIRETVTEPMMGFIRLQWWREAIEEVYAGTPRNHAVVNALYDSLQQTPLSAALFEQLLTAREHDLDEEPPLNTEALVSYMAASSSSLFQLSLEACAVTAPEAHQAAYHLGIAWGLVGYMRAIRYYASSKRVLFPRDLMEQQGISVADILAGRSLEKTQALAQALAEQAATHLAEARTLRAFIPQEALPVFLPAAMIDVFLKRIRRHNYALFHADLEQHRSRLQLAVLWKAWRGSF